MSELDLFIADVTDQLKKKFYKQVTTEELIMRNEGWDLSRIQALANTPLNNSQISETNIRELGPEYFPYSVLGRFRTYRDYPYEFAVRKLLKVEEQRPMSGEYNNYQYLGIKYKSKASEEHIRLLRIEEVVNISNVNNLLNLLGERNDHTYTELEIMGMVKLLEVIKPPPRFIKEVWGEVKYANNGVTLRKRLKTWSLSIKRWPDYWTQRYNCEIQHIIETETVLGYLIEDSMQTYHLELVDDLLSDKYIYYDDTFDNFLLDIQEGLRIGFEQGEIAEILDINLEDFANDWNNWTTAGSASEYRMKVREEDGSIKKLRINKAALPITTTLNDLLNYDDYSAGVLMKAEVGKNRIAFSCPTKEFMLSKYLLEKYDKSFQTAQSTSNYISYSNVERLQFSLDMCTIDSSVGVITADIEENDVNQICLLNIMYMYYMFKSVILPQDETYLLEVLRTMMYNTVRVKTSIVNDLEYKFKAELVKQENGFNYYRGNGGMFSGLGITFSINTANNLATDHLSLKASQRLILKYSIEVTWARPLSIAGGDDRTGLCRTIVEAALSFLCNSGIYLPINPEKSYVSYSTGEFFRIMYIRGERRQGYPSRVIHSILTSNPASTQELDIVNAIKAYWSNCAQIMRRGGDREALISTMISYAKAKGVSEEIISVPTESGGCGVPINPAYYAYRVVPGIPRYKPKFRDYLINKTWFNKIMDTLKVNNIPGVADSYLSDMMTGIKDPTARSEAKALYRKKFDKWKSDHSVIFMKTKVIMPERLLVHGKLIQGYFNSRSAPHAVLDNILNITSDYIIKRKQYYDIRNEYQLFSDILNRGNFPKFSDKLDMLTDLGILFIADNFRNTKSAYVVKNLLNGNLALSSPVLFSFPADMTFLYLTIGQGVLGPITIRTPAEFVWFSDYIRFSVANGFLPYLSWATNW